MRRLISSVALAVCPASVFTSDATTANPRPASPARAASIVAFNASRLVCSAICEMRSTTEPICRTVCASTPIDVVERPMAVAATPASELPRVTSALTSPIDTVSHRVTSAVRDTVSMLPSDERTASPFRSVVEATTSPRSPDVRAKVRAALSSAAITSRIGVSKRAMAASIAFRRTLSLSPSLSASSAATVAMSKPMSRVASWLAPTRRARPKRPSPCSFPPSRSARMLLKSMCERGLVPIARCCRMMSRALAR